MTTRDEQRSCGDKVRHFDRASAERAMSRYSESPGDVAAYHCNYCGKWHWGHAGKPRAELKARFPDIQYRVRIYPAGAFASAEMIPTDVRDDWLADPDAYAMYTVELSDFDTNRRLGAGHQLVILRHRESNRIAISPPDGSSAWSRYDRLFDAVHDYLNDRPAFDAREQEPKAHDL